MQIHKAFFLIFLTLNFKLGCADEEWTAKKPTPAIRENAIFVFSNVKSYKREQYDRRDQKTGIVTTVVNRDFVGTVKVDRLIDFIKIDINLFNEDDIYIEKCTTQEYGTMTPSMEKYFLVNCYNIPSEVDSQYRNYRIEAFSYNPTSPAVQSRASPTTQAPNSISVDVLKEVPKPKFILTNLKSYPRRAAEYDYIPMFVGTLQVDRVLDFISLNADLFDKKGVFLYRCDTQIHDGIAPKVKINFSISCPSLPAEVEKRFHHFKIYAL